MECRESGGRLAPSVLHGLRKEAVIQFAQYPVNQRIKNFAFYVFPYFGELGVIEKRFCPSFDFSIHWDHLPTFSRFLPFGSGCLPFPLAITIYHVCLPLSTLFEIFFKKFYLGIIINNLVFRVYKEENEKISSPGLKEWYEMLGNCYDNVMNFSEKSEKTISTKQYRMYWLT